MALGAGKRALAERYVAQRLIHDYYDLSKTNDDIVKVWPANEMLRRVPLVEIWGHPKRVDAALSVINVALAQTEIFSGMLEAGPVKRERAKGIYRKRTV